MQQGVWDLFFSSLAGFWNDREEQREESYSYTLHQQPSHGRPWAATSMAARRHGPSMTRAYPPARGRAVCPANKIIRIHRGRGDCPADQIVRIHRGRAVCPANKLYEFLAAAPSAQPTTTAPSLALSNTPPHGV